MKAVSSKRRCCCWVGLLLLWLATVQFLLGYSSYWRSKTYQLTMDSNGHGFVVVLEGLWEICAAVGIPGNITVCSAIPFLSNWPVWFQTVQVLESLCLIGAVMSCLYSLLVSVSILKSSPRLLLLEFSSAISGTLGLSGTTIYVVFYKQLLPNASLCWAFAFAFVGSAFIIVAAILISISNEAFDTVDTGSDDILQLSRVVPLEHPVAIQEDSVDFARHQSHVWYPQKGQTFSD